MQDKEYYGEGGENMDKYRINIDELHKKRLGKNTLENRIVHPSKITEAYATDVYHYTSPEGVIGILKNREIFFTDSEYLNDYEERLGINSELEMKDASYYQLLYEALVKAGLSEEEIEKIFYKNVLRVYKEILR